jgi:hypothetical protein
MEVFLRSFARNPDGSWTCVAPATLPRCFLPGTEFMGIDLAGWLEQQFNREKT